MSRFFPWRNGYFAAALLAAAVIATATPGPVLAEPTAAAEAPTLQAAQLPHLAESGRFTELLTRLKTDYPGTDAQGVRSLISDLERYQANEAERRAARQAAYDEALATLTRELEAGRVEDALVAAIDAHTLAEDPPALLERPEVKTLIGRAEELAENAVATNDWVEALSVYRLLDLLFDDYATYREQTKQAGRHLRVLQLYAPEELEKLYRARLERREKAEAEAKAQQQAAGEAVEAEEEDDAETDPLAPLNVDHESWQTRLKGVEPAMLRQTLHQAAREHINSNGYTPLMQGAVESLLVLVRTDALAQTFPSFQNQAAMQEFRNYLERTAASLKAPDQNLGFYEASTIIDKIMLMNDRTLELPEQVLVYEMTEGATQTLDEFSAVIWPQEKETFSRSTQGRFYGIGIQISRRDGRLVVVSPLANTPAQSAGIEAGDIIAQVDGRDTSTWGLDKAVREITGPEGTVVTLGIERTGKPDLIEYRIARAEIVIESIRGWQHTQGGAWDYFIDPDNRIGYVRLSQFIPQTADDLDAAVQQMQASGPLNGLILDLRFNPGGLLSSAIDIVDRFIAEGPIVFTVDATGTRTNESRAQRHRTYEPFPVAVLINQGAASASEIVSGALQDYGRATIIGTRTFGKGSVQDLFPLDHGKAYLKLTTQYYMLPLGRIIHRKPEAKAWGVEPDLVVEMTNQQVADSLEVRQEADVLRDGEADPDAAQAADILTQGLDPQLEAALLVLKTRLVAQHIAMAQAPADAMANTP